MTTVGRPFCWPCRHYRTSDVSHGPIPGLDPRDRTCAALPEGIPWLILAGGFDHREPHPHDNGVRFDMRADERFHWDEEQTDAFLRSSGSRPPSPSAPARTPTGPRPHGRSTG